jgi:hypothetical protein
MAVVKIDIYRGVLTEYHVRSPDLSGGLADRDSTFLHNMNHNLTRHLEIIEFRRLLSSY